MQAGQAILPKSLVPSLQQSMSSNCVRIQLILLSFSAGGRRGCQGRKPHPTHTGRLALEYFESRIRPSIQSGGEVGARSSLAGCRDGYRDQEIRLMRGRHVKGHAGHEEADAIVLEAIQTHGGLLQHFAKVCAGPGRRVGACRGVSGLRTRCTHANNVRFGSKAVTDCGSVCGLAACI